MSLSFAQASFVIGFISGVHPERSGSLESRIKQWQKMGFPNGVNVGRGVKAEYGPTQLCQLLLMLKLLTVGLTPERAIQVIRAGWPIFKDGFIEAASCMANGADHLHYFLIKVDALSDLREPGLDHFHVYVHTWSSDEISAALKGGGRKRASEDERGLALMFKNQLAVSTVLEIDSMLVLLWAAVEGCGGDMSLFEDEFAEWYEERATRGGHAPQDSIGAFLNFYQTSPASEVGGNFDRVSAARKALRKAVDGSNSKT